MRLCYVANPNSIHVRRWIAYFLEQGHEVHILTGRPVASQVPDGAVLHWIRVPRVPRLRNLALGLAMRRCIWAIRPDIVHAHQVSPDGWLAAMAGYHPLLLSAWGSDLLLAPRRALRYRVFIRWALRQADAVVCVSRTLAQAAQALGADPERLHVVPWGVDLSIFRPPEEQQLARRSLGLEGPVVLSLRAMRPLYNPLVIAQAIPQILARVPCAQFVIRTYAADSQCLSRFQSLLCEPGVQRQIRYVGELADDLAIAELYRASDVAISVPSSDGLPQSVFEAMACGVVPVLSDLPSLREWIRHEEEGLFVPVGDAPRLAEAVILLLTDVPLRKRLRHNAIRLVQQRADSRIAKQRYEEIYEGLASRKRTKR
ncbi:MAG: glycosyltransferase family 4 protein [Chloroflexia bacterium]